MGTLQHLEDLHLQCLQATVDGRQQLQVVDRIGVNNLHEVADDGVGVAEEAGGVEDRGGIIEEAQQGMEGERDPLALVVVVRAGKDEEPEHVDGAEDELHSTRNLLDNPSLLEPLQPATNLAGNDHAAQGIGQPTALGAALLPGADGTADELERGLRESGWDVHGHLAEIRAALPQTQHTDLIADVAFRMLTLEERPTPDQIVNACAEVRRSNCVTMCFDGEMLPLLSLAAHAAPVIHIDRTGRTLTLIDDGTVLQTAPVGIGRGGLGEKTTMSDLITPTGTFSVDLILTPAGGVVAPEVIEQFGGIPEHASLLTDLPTLFSNMNRIDFDGDGSPDAAYGGAYIGLTSDAAVTGPKLRRYRDGTIYWYSIALHGTPAPENLGAARSGGCVHLSETLLAALIADGTVTIGSPVIISDGPPEQSPRVLRDESLTHRKNKE